MRFDVDVQEDLIRTILDEEGWDQATDQLSLATSRILAVAVRSIGGELRGFDGACTSVSDCDERTLSLRGDVYWLEKDFGNSIKIDIARLHRPLLYSFKLLDSRMIERQMMGRQTLYIAKTQKGWFYA